MKPSALYFYLRGPVPGLDETTLPAHSAIEAEIISKLVNKELLSEYSFSGQKLVEVVDNAGFEDIVKEILLKYPPSEPVPFHPFSPRAVIRERGRSLIAKDYQFEMKRKRNKLFAIAGASVCALSIIVAGFVLFSPTSQPFRHKARVSLSTPSLTHSQATQNINTLEAWLSFSCLHCKQAWAFLKEVRSDESLSDIPIEYRFVASQSQADQTFALYYEALKLQNNDLAQAFCDWVFENQARLVKNGIQSADLEWIQKDTRFDYSKFQQDVISNKLVQNIQQNVVDYRKQKIAGTPTLVVNGVKISGSDINISNIQAALRN